MAEVEAKGGVGGMDSVYRVDGAGGPRHDTPDKFTCEPPSPWGDFPSIDSVACRADMAAIREQGLGWGRYWQPDKRGSDLFYK